MTNHDIQYVRGENKSSVLNFSFSLFLRAEPVFVASRIVCLFLDHSYFLLLTCKIKVSTNKTFLFVWRRVCPFCFCFSILQTSILYSKSKPVYIFVINQLSNDPCVLPTSLIVKNSLLVINLD